MESVFWLKSRIVRLLMYLIHWTWGILQKLLGLFLMMTLEQKQVMSFHGAILVDYQPKDAGKSHGTFTIGQFIFYSNSNNEIRQNLLTHEYGHTIQSLIYGPFYLPIIGLFSYRWSGIYWKNKKAFNDDGVFYGDRYPEKQANYWGEKLLGSNGIDW